MMTSMSSCRCVSRYSSNLQGWAREGHLSRQQAPECMALTRLRITDLRNIKSVDISPSPTVNYLLGRNGSGKTSILEAIYLIARGRSFRSTQAKSIVRQGKRELTVFASNRYEEGKYDIGLRKSTVSTDVRVNASSVKKLSDLARITPLQIINPNSHEIFDRGPEYRRRLLEWGVFHVEHNYQALVQRYYKNLYQRNAALKGDRRMISVWDDDLSETAEKIQQMRSNYLDAMAPVLAESCNQLLPNNSIELHLKRGWSMDSTLLDQLRMNRQRDCERGFTAVGPHRADLDIRFDGQPVTKVASRGQQKLLISAMHLAQAELTKRSTNKNPIILVDDFSSELDQENQQRLFTRLKGTESQLFLTGVDKGEYLGDARMFHVEHGSIE